MAAKKPTPTVRGRRLAAELRRLRAAADLSREDVSEKTGINKTTLYRIEKAQAKPQKRTLISLLDLYEASDEQRDHLITLLRDAGVQGWLRPHHESLPEEYTAFISFEQEARGVRNYSGLFIPGLLQTEDYARGLISGVLHAGTTEQIEDRVQTRIERQAVLTKDKPLKLSVVIDEAALRYEVGGPEVMSEQRKHLADAAKWPNVTVQVLRFNAGAHPGMPGQFVIMDFEDPMDTDLIYIDSQAGELFLESDEEIRRFRGDFDHLVAMAMSPKDSVAFIKKIDNG